jgi:tight adherence protein B
MSPVLLFGLILVLAFGAIVWVLKPTRAEADVARHMSAIGSKYTVDPSGTTILKQEPLSSVPLVNDILRHVRGAPQLRLFISQAGMAWTVGTVIFGSLLAFFLVTWLSSLVMPTFPFGLFLGLVAGALPFGYLYVKRMVRFTRVEKVLPETVDLMSRALKAGHSVTAAIEMVSLEIAQPVASEFKIVFEEQNLGLPMREAMLNLGERLPLDDVLFIITAILVQKETGGNLAEILDKTAALLRERMRLKGQLRIYTAQGRLTGWFLSLLPFIVFGLINLVNHDYEKALWTDPFGRHLVYASLTMMAIGIYLIKRIVSIKV